MKTTDMTPEELKAQNERIERECLDDIEEKRGERQQEVSTALSHLLGVVESNTIDVEFDGANDTAILKVRASPSQRVMQDIFKMGEAAHNGEGLGSFDEDRVCEILEYLTVDPIIPKAVWMSGDVPDEIAAKVIVSVMLHKVEAQEAIEEDIKNFRKNKRGVKAPRDKRTPAKSTE